MQNMTLPSRLSALARVLAPALVLALAAAAATAQQQQQWKWRDAGGRITVSDLPPPRDVADKDILQRPDPVVRKPAPAAAAGASAAASAAAGASAAPAARAVDKDLEARKRAAEAERQAKAKAEEDKLAQQRAENCRRARSHIATLESGQRIARVNAKGEREILDDAARAAEMRQAREVAASECR